MWIQHMLNNIYHNIIYYVSKNLSFITLIRKFDDFITLPPRSFPVTLFTRSFNLWHLLLELTLLHIIICYLNRIHGTRKKSILDVKIMEIVSARIRIRLVNKLSDCLSHYKSFSKKKTFVYSFKEKRNREIFSIYTFKIHKTKNKDWSKKFWYDKQSAIAFFLTSLEKNNHLYFFFILEIKIKTFETVLKIW